MTRKFPRELVIACALVLVPIVILIVRLFRVHWFSTSDIALIELRVRDVGGTHTPLIGVYSRYGWNHPGPLLLYLLAIPYRILGSDARALMVGTVLLNAAALVGCIVALWRRGAQTGLALGLVVLFILVRALGGTFLQNPWNPYAIVLPLLAFVLVVWSVTCGDHWLLPVAVGLGAFTVQTHVGTALVVVVLLVFAIVVLTIDRAHDRTHDLARILATSVGVAVMLWIPPLIDQLRPSGGNLSALWDYFTTPHKNTPGLVDGTRIVAPQLSLPAPWISGHDRINPFSGGLDPSWHVPFVVLFAAAAGVVAWRRRDRPALMLDVIAFAVAIVAVISASKVVDVPFGYLLRWTWIVGAVAWLAIGWTFLFAIRRFVLPIAAILVASLFIATVVSATQAQHYDPRYERTMERIHGALVAAARAAPQPILIEGGSGLLSGLFANDVLVSLVRAHVDVGFDTPPAGSDRDFVSGGHIVARSDARTLFVAASDDQVAPYEHDPRYRVVAVYDRLVPADRQWLNQFDAMFNALNPFQQLQYLKDHSAELARADKLRQHGELSAIFSASPSSAGNPPPGG